MLCATAALSPMLLMAVPAFGQDQGPAGDEIVVTAQKREQSLIDVPAAISAFSGDKLQALGVQNTTEIAQQVPNFNIVYDRGPNSTPSFVLRGVRAAILNSRLNESSVAVYTDEVFVGDETGLNGALFDLDRVEVLRGPQGTVFGKNTTGGLVHFISAKPTRSFSGHGSIQYGSDNNVTVEGAVSGPLSDRIRVRLAGKLDRDDGHYKNRYFGAGTGGIEKKNGDKDVWGLRGIIDVDLTERTLLRLIGAYAHDNSQNAPGITYGMVPPGTTGQAFTRDQLCSHGRILGAADCIGNIQTAPQNGPAVVGRESGSGITNLTPDELGIRARARSITAILTHDMDWATLTSVTNYTNNRFRTSIDADGGATPGIGVGLNVIGRFRNTAKQFSQELRLNGSNDAFDWVAGLFYFTDKKHNDQQIEIRSSRFSQFNSGGLKSDSYAGFAQLDAHLSNQVTLSVGGRYTKETRRLTEATTYAAGALTLPLQDVLAAMPITKTDNKDFTGKFSLSWKPSADNNFYASYSRGIKGAGFNTGFSPTSPIANNVLLAGPVGQEVLDAFELGSKNRLFDGVLTMNTALFYYDFKGKQEQLTSFNSLLNVSQQNYLNVGNAEIYGIETEVMLRPTRRLDVSFSGGWLHTEVSKSDVVVTNPFGVNVPLEGLPLPSVPKWSFNSYLAYHMPVAGLGEFTIQPEVRATAKINYSLTNDPLAYDKSHVFTNLRLFWDSEDGRYSAQVFVTNLFNVKSLLRIQDTVFRDGKFNVTEGLGRLWGVRLGIKY